MSSGGLNGTLVSKIVLIGASMYWLQIPLQLSYTVDKVVGVELCQPAT